MYLNLEDKIAVKSKYTFSGHESFQCRHLWLKKGYDFVSSGKQFNSEAAVVDLGVGKNMVSSIRFWMRAFSIVNQQDQPTDFGKNLLSDGGWDPHLEDEASLWLLHYQLVKKGFASTYHLLFNELRREKVEFDKSNFISFVKRKIEESNSTSPNEKTLSDDFIVMTKMYIQSDAKTKDREDTFSGLLTELDLVKCYGKRNDEYFVIDNTDKQELPEAVLLYAILDFRPFDASINLSSIEQDINSPGSVFAMNRTGLMKKIEGICEKNKNIVFTDHAGVKELQFKKKPDSFSVLETYYHG